LLHRLIRAGEVTGSNLTHYPHTRVSVPKQYNLVLAKGRRCSEARKVTAGMTENNCCLPPFVMNSITWLGLF